jgi:hypothetical protein
MAILKYIKTLSALLLITLLTGCYTDFTPDIEVQNKLCLNSVITADEPIILSLTRTYRYDEGDPDLGGYFDADSVFHEVTGIGSEATKHIDIVLTDKDASVSLYVNDQYVEDLKYKQYLDSKFFWADLIRHWESTYAPKEGDKVRIVATSNEYGDAEAEVVVPYATPIDSFDAQQFIESEDENILNGVMSLTDPGDCTNYYLVGMTTVSQPAVVETEEVWDATAQEYVTSEHKYYVYTDGRGGIGVGLDFTSDPLFSEHMTVLESVFTENDSYGMFSDRQISGQSYSLQLKCQGLGFSIYNPKQIDELYHLKLRFYLYTISESYYKHLLSVWQRNEGIVGGIGNMGLGEPIFEASNVSTGAGVVAARAKSYVDFDMYPYLVGHTTSF